LTKKLQIPLKIGLSNMKHVYCSIFSIVLLIFFTGIKYYFCSQCSTIIKGVHRHISWKGFMDNNQRSMPFAPNFAKISTLFHYSRRIWCNVPIFAKKKNQRL